MKKTIVILGGYGNFGKRIAKHFIEDTQVNDLDLDIYIVGRDQYKAQTFCMSNNSLENIKYIPLKLDVFESCFKEKLKAITPDIVIHTSGPFQSQESFVASICIDIKCHYIDLADDRRFVCDISSLDMKAKENDVLIVSGASSVPGVSTSVVAKLAEQFKEIEKIDIAIAPGNKAERGFATLKGILSYTGKAFKVFRNSKWTDAYGWMDSSSIDFKHSIGKRKLANVDVPDLEIFPKEYPTIKTVSFQAGLELSWLHNFMVLMAKVSKLNWVKNWDRYTSLIYFIACKLEGFGSADGAMRIEMQGIGLDGKQKKLVWTLVAKDGVGPHIPTFASIILVKKMLLNQISLTGATACVNLFSKKEFEDFAKQFEIISYLECTHLGEK